LFFCRFPGEKQRGKSCAFVGFAWEHLSKGYRGRGLQNCEDGAKKYAKFGAKWKITAPLTAFGR